MGITGRLHSTESFGAVDGPGIRYVVFTQGCPLKCLYCHNPDSWLFTGGKEADSEDVVAEILTYRNFIKSGGVTISGGEPLMQPEFVADILNRLKKENIHTAVDTAGSVPLSAAKPVIDAADMLLLDIKSMDSELCRQITGRTNENALAILQYCEKIKKPVWIRHVLLPQYTLKKQLLENMAAALKGYTCIENVELLPFHKMGEYKWKELGKKYTLYDIEPPSFQDVEAAKKIFAENGLPVGKAKNKKTE